MPLREYNTWSDVLLMGDENAHLRDYNVWADVILLGEDESDDFGEEATTRNRLTLGVG